MGLRCLLGHDFGEPETEREREEQGNEVVVTVRDVKTCSRCGERQVVTENKEVTSLDQLVSEPGEGDANDSAESARDGDADADVAEATPGVADETESDVADADADTDAAAEATHPAERGDDGDDVDPETDDAVILDAEPGVETERDSTQWPDEPPKAEDVSPAPGEGPESADARPERGDATDAPTAPADEDRSGASPEEDEDEDDAIVMADDADDADVEGDQAREKYLERWPDPKADEDEGWSASPPAGAEGDEAVVEAAADAATGAASESAVESDSEAGADADASGETTIESADSENVQPEFERTPTESELEFYCPACGHTRPVGQSSLRAGDICPECREGYIDERPRGA